MGVLGGEKDADLRVIDSVVLFMRHLNPLNPDLPLWICTPDPAAGRVCDTRLFKPL